MRKCYTATVSSTWLIVGSKWVNGVYSHILRLRLPDPLVMYVPTTRAMTCARSRARTALCTTARRPHRGRTNKGAGTGRAATTNKLFTSLSLRILQSLVATQSKKLTASNTQRWDEHPQHPPQGRSARRRFVLSERSLMWLYIRQADPSPVVATYRTLRRCLAVRLRTRSAKLQKKLVYGATHHPVVALRTHLQPRLQ